MDYSMMKSETSGGMKRDRDGGGFKISSLKTTRQSARIQRLEENKRKRGCFFKLAF
jgi:hypothetical protein